MGGTMPTTIFPIMRMTTTTNQLHKALDRGVSSIKSKEGPSIHEDQICKHLLRKYCFALNTLMKKKIQIDKNNKAITYLMLSFLVTVTSDSYTPKKPSSSVKLFQKRTTQRGQGEGKGDREEM